MRRTTVCLLLLLAFCTPACRRCRCADEPLRFNFAGYTAADLEEIILRRYAKGTGMAQPNDSATYVAGQDYRFVFEGDTILLSPRSGGLALDKNWDWQIVLPAAQRTIRVEAIDAPEVKGDCSGKSICINQVRSLRVDGTTIPGPQQRPDIILRR